MLIALTGTPGTGKTSVAEELDYRTVDLTEFVKEHDLGEQKEEFEVYTEEMVEALREEIRQLEETDGVENILVEGHLAHHLESDYCIVLRCNPEELRERLEKRDYSKEKVEENVEAEILDSVLIETVEKQQKIIEIDTTGRNKEEVAEEIRDKIENEETGYGEIDWTDNLKI